jgi:ABC-2 type transport system ATP-binding protein
MTHDAFPTYPSWGQDNALEIISDHPPMGCEHLTDDEYAINVENLTKIYPSSKKMGKNATPPRPAVDGINFKVRRGEIFGLLGPNGAGKTTTIKMLSTLLLPTSGKASVLGLDVNSQAAEIRKRINLVSGGERGLYYRLTGKDNLRFFADLYRVPRNARDERVASLLALVGLEAAADKRVEDYSRGMKQRLHLARGLINDPDVLFLDEPTIGLDPEISNEIRKMVADMSARGKTILLTTHYMAEAEQLCDSINVICKGRIVAAGTSAELKRSVQGDKMIHIEVKSFDEKAIEAVRAIDGVLDVIMTDPPANTNLRVKVSSGSNPVVSIASQLERCGLLRINVEEPTLEDAYLHLVRSDD